DHPDIDDFRRLAVARFHGNAHLFSQDKAAVLAAETYRHAAVLIDHRDNFFVDLSHQYHLDDIERLFVGDAHATDIPASDAHFVERRIDLRAAAMNHQRVNSDIFQQHDVLREARFELLVFHRMTAVFDDEGLAVEALKVRQGLHQDLSLADEVFHHSKLSTKRTSK